MVGKLLSEGEYFYLSNGQSLKSLNDLSDFLKTADLDVFSAHVNSDKNDFYNWVKFALDLPNLAKRIEKISSASLMASEVIDFLNSGAGVKTESVKSVSPSLDLAADDDGNFGSYTNLSSSFSSKIDAILSSTPSEKSEPILKEEIKEIISPVVKSEEIERLDVVEKKVAPKISKKKSKSTSKKVIASKVAKKSISKPELSSLNSSELSKIKSSPKKSKVVLDNDSHNDFDYSFNFDEEKDTLSKIKERISLMDKELQLSGSSSGLSGLSKALVSDKSDVDYPALGHKEISHSELKTSKKSPLHYVKHVAAKAQNHAKNASGHVIRHVKKMHRDIKNKIVDSKKQKEINSYLRKTNLHGDFDKESKVDFEVVNESDSPRKMSDGSDYGMISAESQRKGSFFKSLWHRLKKSEKKVVKHLPNLHEFVHERRAEERLNPLEDVEHKKNYHLHGFPDFIRGLIIGLVIGMLFIVIF